jgi:alkanesulfonate monooxygenase SsuD/methylene tetrahydromethanopterin reductase-like flavin-dependent oxidoreductase (luciferase family)
VIVTVELGIFDIHQLDPTDQDQHYDVYQRRLDDLAYAEAHGLSVAFTAERHFMLNYRCPAATVWGAAASQRTKAMRLGVLAYTLPIRQPVQLAEEIAMLDCLSGGRLEVGVGLGHRTEELVALGIDPAKRVPIFQERLALMEALWTGGVVSFESETSILRNVAIHPVPQQEPYPSLWFAGSDERAALWSGMHGMSLAVGFKPTSDLLATASAFKRGRAERAKSTTGVKLPGEGRIALMRHTYIAESDERALQEITEDLYRLNSLGKVEPGDRADRLADAEHEARQLIKNEIFIAGSPETVVKEISVARGYLGIDLFLANVYAAGIDDDRIRRAIRLLGQDVAAQLKAIGQRSELETSKA